MKIAIVCDVLGEKNNGTTIAANNLIDYLKSRGHEVRVLCADGSKIGTQGYFVVPNRNFLCFNGYVQKNGVSLANPDKDIITAAIAGCDVVHIMMPFALGLASVKIAKKFKIPVSAGFHLLAENVTCHLHMQDFNIANKAVYAHFHKLYSHCDAVHYPTPYLRRLYEGMYGKTNGYVISNGVNNDFKPAKPAEDNGRYRILYVGRLSKEKAHSVLIDAVKLSKYKDKIELVFAGGGPLKEKLVKQAEDLPVQPVFGFFSRSELVNVINGAYLYVHAAEIEAEGISCLEAMACGLVPVICDSERCATKDYALTEHSLFKNRDAQDLAGKIDWWIEHPEEREKYSVKYAEASGVKFDQEACMAAMEKMLSETAFGANTGAKKKKHAKKAGEVKNG